MKNTFDWERAWYEDHLSPEIGDREVYKATIVNLSYSMEKIPRDWDGFRKFIESIDVCIPMDFRGHAKIKIYDDDCGECSSGRARFEVYVLRRENDEEYKARKDGEKLEEAKREIEERATYKRLKRKYGE